jgi:hypothetical protein
MKSYAAKRQRGKPTESKTEKSKGRQQRAFDLNTTEPEQRIVCIKFEVFTAVTMKNGVFWDVTPCDSCNNRRFGELSVSFIRVTRIGELGITLAVTSNRRTLRRNTDIQRRRKYFLNNVVALMRIASIIDDVICFSLETMTLRQIFTYSGFPYNSLSTNCCRFMNLHITDAFVIQRR